MRTNNGQILYIPKIGQRANLQHPLMRGCVGWWPLTDGGGGIAKDLVRGNDGVLNSDVTWKSSSIGKVASFDDTLTSQITVPHDASYNAATTGKISVSAWVKVDATRGDHSVIVGKDDNSSNREWLITIPTNLSVFRLHLWNSSGTLSYFDTSSFSLGDWHFVCMTWDGSTLRGYLDGVADGSTSITSARTTTVGLRIGESSNNKLNGLLQNIRVWNCSLSSSEILELYTNPWSSLSIPSSTRYFFVPQLITASPKLFSISGSSVSMRSNVGRVSVRAAR